MDRYLGNTGHLGTAYVPSQAYAIIDSKWRHVFVNTASEKLTGRSDLTGKVMWDVYPEAVGALSHNQLMKVMNDKISLTWKQVSPIYNVWIEYQAFSWEDGVAVFSRDITERKRAEEELEKHRAHLEKLIKERTQKLAEAKGQAELYLDLMGHDINNLHPIALGYLEHILNCSIYPYQLSIPVDRPGHNLRI